MTEERPNPEQMLARLRTEPPGTAPSAGSGGRGRGRLKVFFGFAPGVGKTYAMLEDARARVAAGVDVVMGYVEPHGRSETEMLLLGQELLPTKEVEYHGVTLREFDLDAALARRPALMVVDELAHTNAPGSGIRHTKRWQDILVLLQHGIDVYTTVNVQHLESLNDIVAQITGVQVRETVPDNLFDEADEVELVDLPPDELLERLAAGKVYVPEQAARAAERFFKKPNLIALRELALRKTADRVNAQVQTARLGQTTNRTWPTRERLLVCVGPSPTSAKVIRSAKRMATAMNAAWIAVAVESLAQPLDAAVRERLTQNLQLAERLGAETTTLTGEDVPAEVIAYASSRNVTKIVIGKPDVKRRAWRTPSIVDQVLARSGEIDVYVIRGFGDVNRTPASYPTEASEPRRAYAYAVGVVFASLAVGFLFDQLGFNQSTVVMTFLMGVALVAAYLGRGPSIAASVLSVLLFNFFFTSPHYTFAITDTQNVVTFLVMLVIGLMVSTLTSRVRRQVETARWAQNRTEALYRLSRRLIGATTRHDIVAAAQNHLAETLGEEAAVFLPDDARRVEARHGTTPGFTRQPNEIAVAQWVFENGHIAGRSTDTLPNAGALYLPLDAPGERVGVLAVRLGDRQGLSPTERQLLETFTTQIALALQREKLADQTRRVLVEAETERTRATLLSAVSHDLRTPLAVIAGSSSSLLRNSDQLDQKARDELLASIHDESNRLSRLVDNLLHLTRLESGIAKVAKEWQPLEEVVGSALARAKPYLGDAFVSVEMSADLPLAPFDGVLIEQVLINLLDNAAKYAGRDRRITLVAAVDKNEARFEVLDEGPGIPAGMEAAIFEKFTRGAPPESTTRGAGLGLAICKAVVEAHGGRIWAENHPAGGARFVFTLPIEGQPPPVAEV